MTSSEVFYHASTTCINRSADSISTVGFFCFFPMYFFSSSNYPHSFTFMHPTFRSFVGLCLLRLSFDICVDVCFYTTCELYSHQLYHLLPFLPPKIYAQPMNTITVQQRCVCVAVYFAYSSLFLLLSLCHNVSCVLLLPMPKEHRLYTVLLLPTLDNPNDNIFWSQKSTEHRRDNTYEKLLNFFFSFINKNKIQTVI